MDVPREFEKYRGGPTLPSSAIFRVTINRVGRIFLNAFTHRKLGKPQAVYLYFSREKDTIMLVPSNPRLPDSLPVMPHLAGAVHINAAPFCRHFGIRIDSTEKFVRPDVDDSGRLILKLSDTVTVTQQRKRKKRAQ